MSIGDGIEQMFDKISDIGDSLEIYDMNDLKDRLAKVMWLIAVVHTKDEDLPTKIRKDVIKRANEIQKGSENQARKISLVTAKAETINEAANKLHEAEVKYRDIDKEICQQEGNWYDIGSFLKEKRELHGLKKQRRKLYWKLVDKDVRYRLTQSVCKGFDFKTN